MYGLQTVYFFNNADTSMYWLEKITNHIVLYYITTVHVNKAITIPFKHSTHSQVLPYIILVSVVDLSTQCNTT